MVGVGVNLGAVLVAAIAAMIVGGIWYSPWLFAKAWMRLMKLTLKKMKAMQKHKNIGRSYVLTFITLLVMAYVLGAFILLYRSYVMHKGGKPLEFISFCSFSRIRTLADLQQSF